MNRTTFEPGPLAHVESRPSGDRWTLVFVRDLRHPPEKVWAALTDPAQLREWSPFTTDRDLGRPGEATLTMIDGDLAEDLPATVTRAEPHICLVVAERLLDGTPIGPIRGEDARNYGWDDLNRAYAETLGIATPGSDERT
jgi:hypothetical protein